MSIDIPETNRWNSLYDILTTECGAPKRFRENFVWIMTNNPECREYRFQGDLGFGGKLYRETRGRFRVDCYLKDRTEARDEMMRKANERIKEWSKIE